MKNLHKTLIFLLLTFSSFSFGQISPSVKANMLFLGGKASWKNTNNIVQQAINDNGKSSSGFNIGLSLKLNLPITRFFLMPEIYYTSFKNSFIDTTSNTTIDAKSNRIDVPVLVGMNVFGDLVSVVIGPVASYNLTSESSFNDFQEKIKNNFSLGYQVGLQSEISKFIVSARYEGAFSSDQRTYVNDAFNSTFQYDFRPSLIVLGLGYKF